MCRKSACTDSVRDIDCEVYVYSTKPLNLQLEEAKQEIVQAINNTGLFPFLLEPIIKDIYNEIVILKQNELEKSKAEYEKSLEETPSEDSNAKEKEHEKSLKETPSEDSKTKKKE